MFSFTRIVSCGVALCAAAAFFTGCYSSQRDIRTLTITGNYADPRDIAELIQVESKQPYILLPKANDPSIWFLPPKGSKSKAKALSKAEFASFVAFINPDQVIILGDERFVPAEYEKMIGANVTVARVKNQDWARVAESLETFLRLNRLARDYEKIRAERYSTRRYNPNQGDTFRSGAPEPVAAVQAETQVIEAPAVKPAPAPAPVAKPAPVVVKPVPAPAPKTPAETIDPIDDPVLK